MIVDVHAHVLVPELARGPGRTEPWRPEASRPASGPTVVSLRGRVLTSVVAEMCDVDAILDASAAIGVDHVVLSPWVAVLPDGLDPAAAAEVCQVQNQALAGAVAAHPGRLDAFGAVTLARPEAAADQVAAAVAAGLVGVEVTPKVGGDWLGADRFSPFWAAAEQAGAAVFVHPATQGLGLDVLGQHYLWNAVGNPVETAVGAAHLVLSGVLERHPGLVVILAHGGGVLPAVAGRLGRAARVRPETAAKLKEGLAPSLQRLYFDTIVHDTATLASLVAWAGSDHVLLGSDRPFDMGTPDPVGEVRALGLDPGDEARILGGNAAGLLGLGSDSVAGPAPAPA
ncbi:MAG: amidohydrolase family protein [Acidimicrobiales bacterium]